jgi:hypothetical protein
MNAISWWCKIDGKNRGKRHSAQARSAEKWAVGLTRTSLDENNTSETLIEVPQVYRGDTTLEVPIQAE